jgi:hypothetical protein
MEIFLILIVVLVALIVIGVLWQWLFNGCINSSLKSFHDYVRYTNETDNE